MINEKKPIDANVLKSRMENLCDEYGTDHLFIDAIVYEIESAPAVGVVRGQWLDIKYDSLWECMKGTCSNCHVRGEVRTKRTEYGFHKHDSPYCPNCSARMEDPV